MFTGPLTRTVKQEIRITNPHSKPIAFKVKTTAPKLYCVRPNSDIIPPNGFADVQSKHPSKLRCIIYTNFDTCLISHAPIVQRGTPIRHKV
jgi:hypothetical protein